MTSKTKAQLQRELLAMRRKLNKLTPEPTTITTIRVYTSDLKFLRLQENYNEIIRDAVRSRVKVLKRRK